MPAGCLTPILLLSLGAGEEPWPLQVFDIDFLIRRPLAVNQPFPPEPVLGTNLRGLEEWSPPKKEKEHESRNFMISPSEEKSEPGLDVAELIRRSLAPGTWEDTGNQVGSTSRRLEVRHEPKTVEAVERLLAALKARAARTLTVEIAMAPASLLDAVAPLWGRPGTGPWLDGDVMDRLSIAGGEEVEYASRTTSPGIQASFVPRAQALRVIDHEVNQTGVLPVTSQVVSAVIEGMFAKVTAAPLPDGRWFRIDARVGRRRPAAKPERRKLHFGEMDLISEVQEDLSVVTAAPPGRTVILGSLAESQDRSWTVLLRLTSSWEQEAPGNRAEGLPVMVYFQAIADALPRFEAGRKPDRSSSLSDPQVQEPDPVLTLLAPEFERGYFTRDTLFLPSVSPAAVASRERLSALAREHLRIFLLEVVDAPLAREPAAAPGPEPDQAWFASAPGTRMRLACVSGARFSVAGARTKSYVADLEMVSGGTGDRTVEIGDPVMGVAGEGLVLRGEVEGPAEANGVRLRLEGERTGPARWRQARTRVSYRQDLRLKEGSRDELEPMESDILIDLPEMEVERLDQDLRMPLGKPVLLRTRPDLEKPGASRALAAMVTALPLVDR
jgi:hypothetical protein